LAVVLGLSLAAVALSTAGWLRPRFTIALLTGGAVIAWAGWRDDRRSLSPMVRVAIHVATAGWAVAWLGKIDFFGQGAGLDTLVSVLGLVWLINVFNFMDGLDGFASSEAVFVTAAGGCFLLFGHSAGASVACWSLAAACLAFLTWNWPPAQIFLGDTGSGYLGYVIGLFALESSARHTLSIWVWLILLGAFVSDATFTLLRRVFRGERWYQPHRAHIYQRAAQQWGHCRVTTGLCAINLLCLVPLAAAAAKWPRSGAWLAAVAITAPLLLAKGLVGKAGSVLLKYPRVRETGTSERIRILHIVPSLVAGGAERFAAQLASELDPSRFDVTVVSLYAPQGSQPEEVLRTAKIAVRYLGKTRGFDPRIFQRLWRVTRELWPHVMHTHLHALNYAIPSISAHLSVRAIHTVHSVAEREREYIGALLPRLLFKGRVVPVAIAKEVETSVRRVYRAASIVIPNGISVQAYRAGSVSELPGDSGKDLERMKCCSFPWAGCTRTRTRAC
jgi:Fuc2NAc and GlcNAc transferase